MLNFRGVFYPETQAIHRYYLNESTLNPFDSRLSTTLLDGFFKDDLLPSESVKFQTNYLKPPCFVKQWMGLAYLAMSQLLAS